MWAVRTAATLLTLWTLGCGGGWEGPPPGRSTAEPSPSPGGTQTRSPSPRTHHGPLEPVDERHEGELTDNDLVLEADGSRYDQYELEAPAGASIVVVMRSEELEPYLHLIGPQGTQLAHGGAPPGESGVAELVLVAPQAAEYAVYANALEPDMRGRYELRIVVEPPPRPAAPEPDAPPATDPAPPE